MTFECIGKDGPFPKEQLYDAVMEGSRQSQNQYKENPEGSRRNAEELLHKVERKRYPSCASVGLPEEE